MKGFRRLGILLAAALASPAWAQPGSAYALQQRGMNEPFRLDVGGYFQKFTTTVRAGDALGGAGTDLGLEDLLGAPDSKTTLRVDGALRLSRRGSLLFGYRTSDRASSALLPRDVAFGDQTYRAGAQVDSRLRVDVFELYYAYALASGGEGEFALLLGVSGFYNRASLALAAAGAGAASESQNLFAPVPAVGATFRYALYPKLFAWGTVKGISGTAWGYHGSMFSWSAGADWYLTRNIGIGGGYESVRLDVQKLETRQFALDIRYDGPVASMKKILQGLARFQDVTYPKHRELFERLAKNQSPQAVFIACSDSRVSPNLIVQAEPGDLFILRNAGNIVPPAGSSYGGTTASLEYAIVALGIRDVILCGHSNCGAMRGILHPETLEGMPAVRQWVSYADAARRAAVEASPATSDEELLERVVDFNVIAQIANVRTFPFVKALAEKGQLELHGWVYDIATGRVKGLDATGKRFVPLGGPGSGPPGEKDVPGPEDRDGELWKRI
jgi:carbonic anhydrase